MTDSLMDEIQSFIAGSYSQELQEDLAGAMALFEAFEYTAPYEQLADTLYDPEQEDPDAVQLGVLGVFHRSLDHLLQCHQIRLQEEISISTKNQVLGVMVRIQNMEDPTPVLRILETDLSGEEQLAKLMEAYSTIDETQALDTFASVSSELLHRLRDTLYQKEEAIEEVSTESMQNAAQFEVLRDFFHVHGQTNLAAEMLNNGMRPGWALHLYLPYVQSALVAPTPTQMAKDLLSLFFMASDTYIDPLQAFRVHSETLLSSVDLIQRVETAMRADLNALSQYTGAKYVARSLSSTVDRV